MPRPEYWGVNIPRQLTDEIQRVIKKNPNGYTSVSDFVKDATRRHIEKIRAGCT